MSYLYNYFSLYYKFLSLITKQIYLNTIYFLYIVIMHLFYLQLLDSVKIAEENAKLSQENEDLKREVDCLKNEKLKLQSDIDALQKKYISLQHQYNNSYEYNVTPVNEVFKYFYVM